MENTNNPFVEYNRTLDAKQVKVPAFPKTKQFLFKLSDEAVGNLESILDLYVPPARSFQARIANLLEQIGLFSLTVSRPDENILDEESGITTGQCRESGYEDGFQGNPQTFLVLMRNPTLINTVFHHAYLRGFFEGNYIKGLRK